MSQIFIGYEKMGSDIHAAMGCNIFRQIVGRKKWWLIPMSELPLLSPRLNAGAFSIETKTLIGRGDVDPSPWIGKLNRWEVEVNPGDMLFNPPWVFHGILNSEGGDSGLNIGVPARHKCVAAGFRSNKLLTSMGFLTISWKYGYSKLTSGEDSGKLFEEGRKKR